MIRTRNRVRRSIWLEQTAHDRILAAARHNGWSFNEQLRRLVDYGLVVMPVPSEDGGVNDG